MNNKRAGTRLERAFCQQLAKDGLLYRDGYYKAREEKENGTTEEGKSDILELHLLKVRNGRIGVIGFEYNLETQRLTQILNN